MPESKAIPCKLTKEVASRIIGYAAALEESAHMIGNHGLDEDEFRRSGLFRAAIERLRGTQAASMVEKRGFISSVLDHMQKISAIASWQFAGGGERHDYEVIHNDGAITAIEAKGCLDGNNTNIFVRPPNADHFLIWSLCQNPGANPERNAWSGIHTRLSAEIIWRKQRVDGLIIWDMLCGTVGRPCPKLSQSGRTPTLVGERLVPPPCLYLFPRTIPDPRNNPHPACWTLREQPFMIALYDAFNCDDTDMTDVRIEVERDGVELRRRTRLSVLGAVRRESPWTVLKRAAG